MGEKSPYKTRQREELLRYLRGTGGAHFTAADVRQHFADRGKAIGTATVYRQLERLIDEGQVKKYLTDEHAGACYEFVDMTECCRPVCYHMKCEICGRLIHMECREITELEEHLLSRHGFRIDPMRTVFHGVCRTCRERGGIPAGKE